MGQNGAADRPISTGLICGILRLTDTGLVLFSGLLAYSIWLTDAPSADWRLYSLVVGLGTLLTLNGLHFAGAYSWDAIGRIGESLRRTALVWVAVVAFLVIVAFLTKISDTFSRGWLLLWFSITLGALGSARVVLFLAVQDWKAQGRLRRNVVVFGAGPLGQRLIAELAHRAWAEVHVLAAFDDRINRSPSYCFNVPVLGTLDDLIAYSREHRIDGVIVALPPSAESRLAEILDRLSMVPLDVRLCTDQIGFRIGAVEASSIGRIPMLNVIDRPLGGWREIVKAVEDRVLAALILAMIAPLMVVIAAAIKITSPGPVFFRQQRHGFNNQLIEVLKFRTMYHDQRDENASQLTRRNDPRVTRLGAFLRRTSLDELPQFINVLRGEMSIVGPRPHACHAKAAGVLYQEAVRRYAARHRVKPGITGWAQVNGWRGETETLEDIRERVRHDLAYIENWSLGLDLKIIFFTAFRGFVSRKAY